METRYLCKKKTLNKGCGGYIESGDIVKVSFTPSRKVNVTTYNVFGREKHTFKITQTQLSENFILYDEIETLNAWDALNILANKFSDNPCEKDIIAELRYYLNRRQQYLKQCVTEDTH